eukprot:TRINITY_DN67127_c0_g1_i1.p1 TRINITY_DN67127_c0_g1~~TRINITY_DN67127_c0_g1_i1.p1  ORF type:complete len:160 (-),score=12.94 TRINITY_DN67127_c0_g1_i1:189-668(-)
MASAHSDGDPRRPADTEVADWYHHQEANPRQEVVLARSPEYGFHCHVRKHAHGKMGAAVVAVPSLRIREAILEDLGRASGAEEPYATIGPYRVTVSRHVDKYVGHEASAELFASWGNRNEKAWPLPVWDIVTCFDWLVANCISARAPQPCDVPLPRLNA